MASRLIHLRKLMRNERLVIALLRGEKPGCFGPPLVASFEGLSREMRDQGLKILDPSACYAGFEETRLLFWLATLQRRSPIHLLDVGQDLRRSLQLCADGLDGAGLHLDYRAINRHHADNNGAAASAATSLSFPSCATACKQAR